MVSPRLTKSKTDSGSAHAGPGWPARTTWVRSAYRATALLLLNTLLLFALLNLALGAFFYLSDGSYKPTGTLRYPKAYLAQVYPHMREEEWRALLKETQTLQLEFVPYTHFKERPRKGKYVNVTEGGFRVNKRQGPWPPNPRAVNIFFFGGSTTFGYGVRDDETIPSVLQDLLPRQGCTSPIYVYNFGRGGHNSSQEQILFARLLLGGFTPQLAIFLDGINEVFDSADQPLLNDEFKVLLGPQFFGGKPKGTVYLDIKIEMPLSRAARIAKARLKRILVRKRPGSLDAGNPPQRGAHSRVLLANYLRNKALIEAIAGRFGVETLFVWQPSPVYGYDLRYHPSPPPIEEVQMMLGYATADFKEIRARVPEREQERMLWLGDLQRDKKEPLYVDEWHYTAAFSREIAKQIAQALPLRSLACRGAASITARR